MHQDYWCISASSEEIQENFLAKARKFSDLNSDDASSIIFGAHDQTICLAGQTFHSGHLIGNTYSPRAVGLVFGLNHVLYDPDFDHIQYIADSRNSFVLQDTPVITRGSFLDELSRAKRMHEFAWIEGQSHFGSKYSPSMSEISSLTLNYRALSVTLTVESDEVEDTPSGTVKRVSVRNIQMLPSGVFYFRGNHTLSVFDEFLVAALVSGWVVKSVQV